MSLSCNFYYRKPVFVRLLFWKPDDRYFFFWLILNCLMYINAPKVRKSMELLVWVENTKGALWLIRSVFYGYDGSWKLYRKFYCIIPGFYYDGRIVIRLKSTARKFQSFVQRSVTLWNFPFLQSDYKMSLIKVHRLKNIFWIEAASFIGAGTVLRTQKHLFVGRSKCCIWQIFLHAFLNVS